MTGFEPVCPLCEGEVYWAVEITGAAPNGTGYEILVCSECEAIVERRWTGF